MCNYLVERCWKKRLVIKLRNKFSHNRNLKIHLSENLISLKLIQIIPEVNDLSNFELFISNEFDPSQLQNNGKLSSSPFVMKSSRTLMWTEAN